VHHCLSRPSLIPPAGTVMRRIRRLLLRVREGVFPGEESPRMAQQARCLSTKTCKVLKFTKIGRPGFKVRSVGRSTTRNVIMFMGIAGKVGA